MYDIVIIGGGVIGCAIARELSRYQASVCVVEKEEDVCCGTSKANSAIVHAGFDAPEGTLKARFNVAGSAMMADLCAQLDVPYRRCGALVLSFDSAERPQLEALLQRGLRNGVEGLELLEREALHRLEPNLSPAAEAALYAPGSAIICPFTLTYALAENAAANGVSFRFDTRVERLVRCGSHFRLHTDRGLLESRVVINAAGVYADTLHNQLCDDPIRIVPRRGEYCLLDKRAGQTVHRTVFQLPGKMGKGVLVTPTVHGNLLVGPTAADQADRDATATTAEGLEAVAASAAHSVPQLPMSSVITAFAGLRAHIAQGAKDFIVGQSADGFFEAAGIESPGLSSAPAIGVYLAQAVAAKLDLAEKADFVAHRRGITVLRELPLAQQQALVAQDGAYGQIICRCEQISEGEIREAIRRGARSLDGVKRRVRAGMGRCQGGFCAPRVMELLQQELGCPLPQLTKSGGESPLVQGLTKEDWLV